jgi:hypothetical protein
MYALLYSTLVLETRVFEVSSYWAYETTPDLKTYKNCTSKGMVGVRAIPGESTHCKMWYVSDLPTSQPIGVVSWPPTGAS